MLSLGGLGVTGVFDGGVGLDEVGLALDVACAGGRGGVTGDAWLAPASTCASACCLVVARALRLVIARYVGGTVGSPWGFGSTPLGRGASLDDGGRASIVASLGSSSSCVVLGVNIAMRSFRAAT